ncbi:MAG: cell division protein FtsZ [Verrucomicrobia bacterium]|nr:cell division protein FtsZ [Verrucomicrobiota bacterium]
MTSTEPTIATAAPVKKQLTIKVFGLGGCGGNVATQIHSSGFGGAQLIVLNTDSQALAQCPLPYKFNLGLKLNGGLGAGGDPERGRAAAEEDEARLRELCTGVDMVLICAGLGGGTGTGAGPVLARVAKECGALALAFVTLPFDCEGSKRMRQARLGLEEFKAAADGVICLPNQKVFKLIDENTSVIETFATTNELLAQGVRGIWQLVTRPGLINLDFADLCAVVRDRHSESSFASAEAAGPHRVKEVVEKLLENPLLDGGAALGEADALLVSLMGGPSLTMAEVSRVMDQINRHCENAHLMMGAAIEEALGERLTVTLVASRRSSRGTDLPKVAELDTAEPAPAPRAGSDFDLLGSAIASKPQARNPAVPFSPEGVAVAVAETEAGVVAPAPVMASRSWRSRKKVKPVHPELGLETVTTGPFQHSEPTRHNGVNLDVPTFVRRGMPMN